MKQVELLYKIKDILINKLMMDKRTIEKPIYSPENDYYYDGIYEALKIIVQEIKECEAKGGKEE